jgi:hypothetical protein
MHAVIGPLLIQHNSSLVIPIILIIGKIHIIISALISLISIRFFDIVTIRLALRMRRISWLNNSWLRNSRLSNIHHRPVIERLLALPTLLLGWHDLEVTIVQRALRLGLRRGRPTLLSDFAPATARLVLSRARSVALVDDALLSKLATSQELLGEVAAVDVVGSRVHGFRDELLLGRKAQ